MYGEALDRRQAKCCLNELNDVFGDGWERSLRSTHNGVEYYIYRDGIKIYHTYSNAGVRFYRAKMASPVKAQVTTENSRELLPKLFEKAKEEAEKEIEWANKKHEKVRDLADELS